MKSLYLLSFMFAAALATTGCSNSDSPYAPEPDSPVKNKKIQFSAGVNRDITRAPSTTTQTINEFVVYGFNAGDTLMNNVLVTRTGENTWTYDDPVYWPANKDVNFYAYSPRLENAWGVSVNPGGQGHINGYQDSMNTTDLLYAVAMGETESETAVKLNFRHAMSKVQVLLSCVNPNIDVTISNIELSNIWLKGTFTFPMQTTSGPLAEGSAYPDAASVGKWSDYSLPTSPWIFHASTPDELQTLTATPTDYSKLIWEPSFFIPQPLEKIKLVNGKLLGNFIEVDCLITDKNTGQLIWPDSNTPEYLLTDDLNTDGTTTRRGRLIFNLSDGTVTSWEPGSAYIYNIVINDIDLLDKINFTVTVDDYLTHELGF